MKGMVFLPHSHPFPGQSWAQGLGGRDGKVTGIPAGSGSRWKTSCHVHEGTACPPCKHNPEVGVSSSFTCRVQRDRGGLVALQCGELGFEDPSWLWPLLSLLSCMSIC